MQHQHRVAWRSAYLYTDQAQDLDAAPQGIARKLECQGLHLSPGNRPCTALIVAQNARNPRARVVHQRLVSNYNSGGGRWYTSGAQARTGMERTSVEVRTSA